MSLIIVDREERARDEPALAELQKENKEIMATLTAMKDIQTQLLKAIADLKEEKNEVLQARVRTFLYCPVPP